MDSLIKRLQDAESGSRELDADIALSLIPKFSGWIKHPNLKPDSPAWMLGELWPSLDEFNYWLMGSHGAPAEYAPSVTTSLDAIVALIGEKLPLPVTWGVQQFANGKYEAHIESHEGKFLISGDMEVYDIAPTPALALCVVLLQALQSQEPTP
jgi:hypothetical protein